MKRSDTNKRALEFALPLALAGLALIVFWPALGHGFIDLDDPAHITANPWIRHLDAASLRWAFSTFYSDLWNPLLWMLYMAEYRLFGLAPAGYHAVSVLLHACSAVMLYFVLRQTTDRPEESAAAAMLFAIHPLRVESVAFAAETKDVLSGFFWMATLWAYAVYARRPSASRLLAALAAYAAALLSKPMVVTLPIVLLLFDLWPLRREREGWKRLLLEKIPFAGLAAGVCLLTVAAQRQFLVSQSGLPFSWRLASVPYFYVLYLGKILWPAHLALFYRHPGYGLPIAAAILAAALLVAISAFAIRCRRDRSYFTVGWFWFLITLFPVIGLVQVAGRSIADRFTYIPQIGLCVIAAWGALELVPKLRRPLFLALALVLACATRLQLRVWASPIELYERTLAVSPDNELIENILGVALARQGRMSEAETHFRRAIDLRPNYADAYNDLGLLLAHEGRSAEAEQAFRKALTLEPGHAQAQANLRALLGARR